MTATAPRKHTDDDLPPESERFLRCCADISNALIEDYEAVKESGRVPKDVNLNALRSKFSKKHKISNMPALTAIIAAVPENYKKYILPKLVAKPIRKSCLDGL